MSHGVKSNDLGGQIVITRSYCAIFSWSDKQKFILASLSSRLSFWSTLNILDAFLNALHLVDFGIPSYLLSICFVCWHNRIVFKSLIRFTVFVHVRTVDLPFCTEPVSPKCLHNRRILWEVGDFALTWVRKALWTLLTLWTFKKMMYAKRLLSWSRHFFFFAT